MPTKKLGEIITFYSFKGGTGRTMALSNLAVLASRVSRATLLIDWDLEAPGLHKFFYKNIRPEDYDLKAGLIDFFSEVNQSIKGSGREVSSNELKSILRKVDIKKYIIKTDLEGLYIIKAGKFDETYSKRINEFEWVGFFNSAPNFFSLLATHLKEQFNYIFVDSRTGFTDTSGICTFLLPDKLCLVFTTNRQSLDGVAELAKKALTYRLNSNDFRPLKLYPIPSRIELGEKDLREIWRKGKSDEGIEGYQPMFEKIFEDFYGIKKCDLTNYFDLVQIHHEPKYSYGESIAVLTETFLIICLLPIPTQIFLRMSPLIQRYMLRGRIIKWFLLIRLRYCSRMPTKIISMQMRL
jgi:eukaryotic-like serine/threonine-protein kinase